MDGLAERQPHRDHRRRARAGDAGGADRRALRLGPDGGSGEHRAARQPRRAGHPGRPDRHPGRLARGGRRQPRLRAGAAGPGGRLRRAGPGAPRGPGRRPTGARAGGGRDRRSGQLRRPRAHRSGGSGRALHHGLRLPRRRGGQRGVDLAAHLDRLLHRSDPDGGALSHPHHSRAPAARAPLLRPGLVDRLQHAQRRHPAAEQPERLLGGRSVRRGGRAGRDERTPVGCRRDVRLDGVPAPELRHVPQRLARALLR